MLTPVPTRRFGRTELAMPVFSCGGMRYQHSWNDEEVGGITEDGQRNLEATIERALDLGLYHIETARGYGTSEIQLGRILPRLPRDRMLVQTKVGPRDTAQEFIETTEKSLKNLQLDYVDLLGIHGINNDELLEQVLRKGGTLDGARQLQREGRCRFVGFSTHGYMEPIRKANLTGEFDYVNLHWYFVNPFTWPAVEAAHEMDMGVFIISPNDKGGMLYQPSAKMVELCAPLTPMAFNDLYCLARPEVHTLSVGAARPSDFDVHVEALRDYDRAGEVAGSIAGRIRTALADALGEEWCEHWHEGLPFWKDVPGEINVFEILRLWNLGKALDMINYGKMRYNLFGEGEHWFPGNSAEHLDQVDQSSVLAGSPFAEEIPDRLREADAMFREAPIKRLSESE